MRKEKGGVEDIQTCPPAQHTRIRPSQILYFAGILLLIASHYQWISHVLSSSNARDKDAIPCQRATKPFRWGDVKPSQELEYQDCYDGFQCARLERPMDYRRTDGKGQKIAVAIARLPAKVPVTDPRYGGAILINPGGPGGSGVAYLLRGGSDIQRIVDSDLAPNKSSISMGQNSTNKYFDIVGFDPRGINNTTPTISCFPNSFARQNWKLQAEAEGMLGSSDLSLRLNWRRSGALSEGCSKVLGERGEGGEALGEFVHTAAVASDMVEIIESHAQWRERQGQQAQIAHDQRYGHDRAQSILARTNWNRGKEKLQYWGFSYGTILGATFASMFPDKVERVAVNGVADSIDYYNGTWVRNLFDTDKVLNRFALYCDEAGPEKCAFYRTGGAQAILEAYHKVLKDIWDDPLSVPGTDTRGPEVITWSDVHVWIRMGLYQPLHNFPVLAELLNDITVGNGSLFADYKQGERTCTGCPSLTCEIDGPYSHECTAPGWGSSDVTTAVVCTDGIHMGDVDEEGFKEYWAYLKNQSEALGDQWASIRLTCVKWNVKARGRFDGTIGGNTSHPLLFIGNTLDTVTPIRNARKMSSLFNGSVVLQHDAEGHCSIAAPSICTAKAIRKYFQTGVIPAVGTICEPDIKPLIGTRPSSMTHQDMSPADAELWEALKRWSKDFPSWVS